MSDGDPMGPESVQASAQPRIEVCPLCPTHHRLLMVETGYLETDPWRALTIVVQIALFQAMTVDPRTHEAIGGDLLRLGALGCMACRKPDAFGEICEAAKGHDLGAVKALGERWIEGARESPHRST